MQRTIIQLALTLTLFSFPADSARAQITYDWVGGSGSWNNNGNWSGGPAYPGANDTARFNAGGNYTISSRGSRTVGAIQWMDGGATLRVFSDSSLTAFFTVQNDFLINGELDIESNDNVASTLRRVGTITNAPSGVINLVGESAQAQRYLRADLLVNNGTVNVDGSSLFNESNGVYTNNATMNVANGVTLAFGANNVFNQDGGTFDNQGSFLFSQDTLNYNGGNFTGNPIQLTSSTLNNNTTGTGTFDLFGSNSYSGDLDANQFLNLISNASLTQFTTAAADFTNRSTIHIESNDNVASTLRRDGTITNAPSGVINLVGDSAQAQRYLRADLLVNNGTVNVDGSSLFNESNGVYTNNATMNVANGVTLAFGSNNVFNQDGGTFDNQGSFLFSQDTLNYNGGNFTGNPIQLTSSTLNNNTTGTGTFDLFGSNSYSGDLDTNQFLNLISNASLTQFTTAAADFTNRSTIHIESNDNVASTLRRIGTITNAPSGVINLVGDSAQAQRNLRADLLVNNGTVNVDGSSLFNESNGVYTNNATMNVANGVTLAFGSNNVFNQDGGTFDNQGSFLFSQDTLNYNGGNFTGNPIQLTSSTLNNNSTGTGTFDLFGSNSYSGDLDANQFLNLISNASLTQFTTAAADFTNRSTIHIESNDNVASTLRRAGTITNAPSGVINLVGDSAQAQRYLRADLLVNNGTVNVDGGAWFNEANGVYENAGIININSSELNVGGSATLSNLNGGILAGEGVVRVGSSGLQNEGRISPGFSAGRLEIEGEVTFGATGKLRAELGGTVQDTEYDHLVVSSSVVLDGELQVRFIDGFLTSLALSDTFDLITTTSPGGISGTFAGLPNGARFDTHDGFGSFDILYLGDVVRIGNFIDYLPGDFDNSGGYECADVDALVADIAAGSNTSAFDMNGDSFVNLNDLNIWLKQASSVYGYDEVIRRGDANLDGVVDGQDFIEWNDHKFTSTAAWCSGDFNADGVVDGQDFILWNSNRFQSVISSLPGVSGTVPEPSSCSIALVGLLLFAFRQGRH